MQVANNTLKIVHAENDAASFNDKGGLKKMFNVLAPKTIAVVGASANVKKRGYRSLQYLLDDGFEGKIYPVNPKRDEILGLKCYSDVYQLPEGIDLVLICTPAITVPSILEACGKQKAKGAVILAAGFKEIGGKGEELEQKIRDISDLYGIRLIGPNTSGMFNTHSKVNLVGFPDLKAGPIGVLSQSGNMALSIATEGENYPHLGFSTYVGEGNKADVETHEYLDYFAHDDHTKTLIVYTEGITSGSAFLKSASEFTAEKPLIVFKSGRTDEGQESALSHTGALAGDYAISKAVMEQAGVTMVTRTNYIMPIAEALALLPKPSNNRLAILSDGGGHATIASDELIEAGLRLAQFSPETTEALNNLLTEAASTRNPVDLAGAADMQPDIIGKCAEIVLADENVDGLIISGLFGGYSIRFSEALREEEEETARNLGGVVKKYNKPVILQSIYKEKATDALRTLQEAGVPVHSFVETSVRCMEALIQYGTFRSQRFKPSDIKAITPSHEAQNIINASYADNRDCLFEYEGTELLKSYNIPTTPYALVTNESELSAAQKQFGDTPIAMKLVSQDILHKTDAGGVKLNLTASDYPGNYNAILSSAKNYKADADIKGVLISPMQKSGTEIIIGVTRDPQFGHVIMFGLGGVFVEVLKDVSFRSLPLTETDAKGMIEGIKAKVMLEGFRGSEPVDKDALVALLLKVSDLVVSNPEIEELDLNPILAYKDGYSIVDTRVILETK
ncbi:MAG: acetate--CoA ligase family protein [Alphaproteobacteria bacterium]